MKSTFLAVAIATAALNLFAPAVGHAQGYIVNGHNASKAEAQFLASYNAPAGHWQVDGYGISRVADEHPAPPVVTVRPPAASAGMSSMCSFATDLPAA